MGSLYLTHFCKRLSKPHSHSVAGRIVSIKDSNDTIGNRKIFYGTSCFTLNCWCMVSNNDFWKTEICWRCNVLIIKLYTGNVHLVNYNKIIILFIIISGSAAQRGLWPAVALQPSAGYGLLVHEVSWPHTTTRHSRQDSSGRVISSSQRSLPDKTQHTQQTNIHAPGEIRTHHRRRWAVVDLRLRPRGHWDRHL
jgi:hypothetical protein